jgi:hypothetical protein
MALKLHSAIAPVGLWMLTVGSGLGYLLVYSNTPGEASSGPEHWPRSQELVLDSEFPTLLMFAHPRCPCTRASLHELNRLVAQVDGRLRGYVLFSRPAAEPIGWERSELWSLADSIPGMTVLSDPDGQTARAFGSETSGHVLLYDPAGELVFSGGVTAARAHEGDNRGRDAIRNFTNEGSILEKQTPVFGCALRELAATPLAGVAGD